MLGDRSCWEHQGILRPYCTGFGARGSQIRGQKPWSPYEYILVAEKGLLGRLWPPWSRHVGRKRLAEGPSEGEKKGTALPHVRYVLTAEVRVIK